MGNWMDTTFTKRRLVWSVCLVECIGNLNEHEREDKMDIDTFLHMRPAWAYEPCLYIVKQMFPGNNAHRCGAAGTQLFKHADLVYGADKSGSLTGLLGRMTMYRRATPRRQTTLNASMRPLCAEPAHTARLPQLTPSLPQSRSSRCRKVHTPSKAPIPFPREHMRLFPRPWPVRHVR